MGGMQTCYWRQGELERIIPGSHDQDNAYKTLWLIHYFHANPEPNRFSISMRIWTRFFYVDPVRVFHYDADSDHIFHALNPRFNLEVEKIKK
jgi:hypothetical protein